MKKICSAFLLLTCLGIPTVQYAQTVGITDPFDDILMRAAQHNPNFRQELKAFQDDIAAKAAVYMSPATTALKGTGTNRTIPVIFHVVLNNAQMQQMADTPGIITRIKSQIDVLNENFNAKNADSTSIPAAFKPLFANLNIKFALATKDPQGNPSRGYEFIRTTKTGFDAQNGGTTGSTYYCSDAKYASTGGANAWDATKYLNVWVINITPAGVGGVGTPPPYAIYGGTTQFPWAEQGVAIAYGTLGKQTSPSQYFLAASANKGRVLVHELGHFFNLFHPFGMSTMNNSNCQDDDGVTDTPPQAAPTQSVCPTFPKTDGCSPASPGIMFMNHMDYADETCRLMFSTGQKARVYVETETSGAFRYDLFQHPELVSLGVRQPDLSDRVNVYPNPATSYCNVVFDGNTRPDKIVVTNQLGQIVFSRDVAPGMAAVQLNTGHYPGGLYLLRCIYKEGIGTKKIVVR